MLAILTTHPIQYQVPLWRALANRGNIAFEVWYLSLAGARPHYDPGFGRTMKWDIDLLSGYPYRILKQWRGAVDPAQLAARLSRSNVRALWINGWQVAAYWQATIQAHATGVPVWLRAESNDLHRPHWAKMTPRQLLLGQLFRRISHFMCIGSANRRLYMRFGVAEDRLTSAPYCVDNEHFAQSAQELAPSRLEIRRTWGIPEKATCFLFSGKLISKKRPMDVLSALERLVAEQPSLAVDERIHVLFAGDGELRRPLARRAETLQRVVGKNLVTFAGFLNQTVMPRAYAAADCLILPSNCFETWGLVVNEALASGRPAIVSDQCGCAEELALPLGREFIFGCGDILALAHRMQRLTRGIPAQMEARCEGLVQHYAVMHTVRTAEFLFGSDTNLCRPVPVPSKRRTG